MPNSLSDFFRDVSRAAVAVEIWKLDMLEKGGKIIEEEAKRVIGTYEYDWPPLADSTQKERERLGYPPNEPLLRDPPPKSDPYPLLRGSIGHTVVPEESAVEIGSNNPKAVWHELGTSRAPPRSFLGGAARAKEKELHEMVGSGLHMEIMAQLGLAHKA